MEPDSQHLTDTIAYALWQHYKLRPKTRDLDEMKVWAAHVVDHLELCGYEFKKKPERPLHSTP